MGQPCDGPPYLCRSLIIAVDALKKSTASEKRCRAITGRACYSQTMDPAYFDRFPKGGLRCEKSLIGGASMAGIARARVLSNRRVLRPKGQIRPFVRIG